MTIHIIAYKSIKCKSIVFLIYFVYYIGIKEVKFMIDFEENKRKLKILKEKLKELGESL